MSCGESVIQDIADDATVWSANNEMQLIADKTTEMIVSFARKVPEPPSVSMGGKVLERISFAKILGVIVSSDLSWAKHIQYICPQSKQASGSTFCACSGDLTHPAQTC